MAKAGHSPAMSAYSTTYGSATPRACFSDISSDDEEDGQITSFNIVDSISSLFFGTCLAVPPSPMGGLVTEVVAEKEEEPGVLPHLLKGRARVQPSLAKPAQSQARVRYDFDKLEELRVLGYGAFGIVTLVKCHTTGQTLALKKMSKGMIVKNGVAQMIKNEKLAMRKSSSPFVIRLAACFNRSQHLYFLMEAAVGGDLFTFYSRNDAWGSEVHARFYIACGVSALAYLHSQHIIYRDVKLENIVLDAKGYAKLCDFGLARVVEPCESRGSRRRSSGKAYTKCGTPEYMAPETVSSRGYSVEADWWSLGVLAFSILTGRLPFNARNPRDIMAKARAGINRVKFPEDKDWPELVQGLCEKDPQERLPMLDGGLSNIQDLPWYSNAKFDWVAHSNLTMVAPYLPEVANGHQASEGGFDEMEPPVDVPYVDPCSGWDDDFEDLEGPVRFDK